MRAACPFRHTPAVVTRDGDIGPRRTADLTDATAALRRHFGHPAFKPGQQAVIERLLAGRSAAAVFPTGGGKSLCYQLPALLIDGLTLVVSPLVALMKDQIDALKRRGIAAARLDGSLDADTYRAVHRALRSGALRLLYVAPERFNNERFRYTLRGLRVGLFAVDEAHCVSEWGHNFRPDYLKLAHYAEWCGAERVLALTATATPRVLEQMCARFGIELVDAVRTGVYRENLELNAADTSGRERLHLLEARLRSRPAGSTIVYVSLQRTAESVAKALTRAGLPAEPYHAGLDAEQRRVVQERWLASHRGIIVATIAFGMGIDKADVRYVYHFNLPKSVESYCQEVGRAGRDGAAAVCEVFVDGLDRPTLENFVYGDTPTLAGIRSLLDGLFAGHEETVELSVDTLGRAHDIRPLVVRTLLTYLELDGWIEAGTPFYSSYKFKPAMSSREMLAKLPADRRGFTTEVLRRSKKARTWISLDVDAVARELAVPRAQVVDVLDDLESRGFVELQAAGVLSAYRRLRRPPDLDVLAYDLMRRMEAREAEDIARLDQVIELLSGAGCITQRLCAYFGEPRDAPCGRCCRCRGETPFAISRFDGSIDEATWAEVKALRAEHAELTENPRLLAKMLAGVSSPRLTQLRLTRHPLFGALDAVPFEVLLSRIASITCSTSRAPASHTRA